MSAGVMKALFDSKCRSKGILEGQRKEHYIGQAHRKDERESGAAARALRLLGRVARYDERTQLWLIDDRDWMCELDPQAVELIRRAFQPNKETKS